MVLCKYRDCSVAAKYGLEGTAVAEFCSKHKKVGMVDTRGEPCAFPLCSKHPSYGKRGTGKREVCGKHKTADMVYLPIHTCASQGCFMGASYGTNGTRKPEFCGQHKSTGMVDVRYKSCAHKECSKFPLYGMAGSRKTEFCGEHKSAVMVNVHKKRCAHEECSKFPTFGTDGSRKAEFCGVHKKTGMVDVRNKRCAHEGCSKQASFGMKGSRNREFCSEHKKTYMIDYVHKRCAGEGCAKNAVYGLDGSKKQAMLCGQHFTNLHEGGASALEAARGEEADDTRDEASVQMTLPNTRKRALRFEPLVLQVDKKSGSWVCGRSSGKRLRVRESENRETSQETLQDSGLVREETPRPLHSLHAILPSQKSSDKSRGAKPAETMPTRRVVDTNRGEREMPVSTGTTGSNGGVLRCGGDSEDVEAGAADGLRALETSRGASAARDAPATSSQVKNLQDKVVNLEKSVADAAASRAQAVAEATGKVQQETTAVIQALRGDLTTTSTGWQSTKNDLKHMRQERDALRSKVTKIQARVYSASNKIKTEATKTEDDKKTFERRIKTLRAMHTAASTGWENTKEDLKKIRQERDALREQVTKIQAQVSSAASTIETEAKRMEHAREDYEQRIKAKEMVGATDSGAVTPTSVPQAMVIGLSTIVSTAACLATAAAAQSSVSAPPTEIRAPTASAVPSNVLENVVREGEVHKNMSLCERRDEAAEGEDESPSGCLQSSTVSIKPKR